MGYEHYPLGGEPRRDRRDDVGLGEQRVDLLGRRGGQPEAEEVEHAQPPSMVLQASGAWRAWRRFRPAIHV